MSIEAEYLGFKIVYHEDSDLWKCWDLKFEAPKLSKLKDMIRQHDADTRRVDQVGALQIGHFDSRPIPCTMTLIASETEVWVTVGDGKKTKREKVKFELLAPDTKEVRAAVDKWQAAKQAELKAKAEAEALKKAIPRVTRKYLDELRVAKAEALT